jgi:hypothetical protein
MSVESILLIVLLIVLPLLERLIGILRQRSRGRVTHERRDGTSSARSLPAERRSPASAGGSASNPKQASDRSRPMSARPRLPQDARGERLTPRAPPAASREATPRTATIIVGRTASSSRPAFTRWSLDGVADLRHGIVLMTILGPCRALQSRESTDRPYTPAHDTFEP